jgi:hypothetical protein
MSGKPESFKNLLRNSTLQSVQAQLEIHRQTLATVRRILPEFLGAQCVDCVVKGDRIILYTGSSAWTTQLRFYGPQLLSRLNSMSGQRFMEIQFRNRLPFSFESSRKPNPPTLPPQSVSDSLRESANNSSSQEIKEALLKLSKTIELNARKHD